MQVFQRVIVVAAGLFAFGAAPSGAAGQETGAGGAAAAVWPGRIAGTVTDVEGRPLDGAMVSAFGPFGAELVVSDGDGRFVLVAIPTFNKLACLACVDLNDSDPSEK